MTGRLRFGPFETDLASGELWRDGSLVPLQDLPFRLLAALLERPGDVLARAELAQRLWGADTFVDAAAGLHTAVAKLREALGDDPDRPIYIETVPKRGYRFVGKLEAAGTDGGPGFRPTSEATLKGRPPSHAFRWITVAAAACAIVAVAAYRLVADRAAVRVAVVLFDNETGNAALAPFAQALTDATVTELTGDRRLAVIGNAAVLRTARPFRDIQLIRDQLGADYIVIGQVQARDGDTLVRAHLIRGRDQAHVWVGAATRADRTEAAFQADVAGRIRGAVSTAVSR